MMDQAPTPIPHEAIQAIMDRAVKQLERDVNELIKDFMIRLSRAAERHLNEIKSDENDQTT